MKFVNNIFNQRGTWSCSWIKALRYNSEGLIPDGGTGIFHLHNPSGHTMALGLNQPLTEMSIRNISWR